MQIGKELAGITEAQAKLEVYSVSVCSVSVCSVSACSVFVIGTSCDIIYVLSQKNRNWRR